MTGYIIRNTPGDTNRFHVCRPGEKAPAFMVSTIQEAFAIVDLDKAQPVLGVTIELPWPPKELSPNARVHWARKSKVAKAYRKACWALTMAAGWKAPEGKLYFWITFCPPNRRARDDDNLLASFKSGRDGVADGLGIDDKNFVTTLHFGDPAPGGMVSVHIREYPIKETA